MKPVSWSHVIIATIVMAVFYFIIPELPKWVYAGLIPVAFFYGREVFQAEHFLPDVSLKNWQALIPWKWPDRDNRDDFYHPVFAIGLLALLIKIIP